MAEARQKRRLALLSGASRPAPDLPDSEVATFLAAPRAFLHFSTASLHTGVPHQAAKNDTTQSSQKDQNRRQSFIACTTINKLVVFGYKTRRFQHALIIALQLDQYKQCCTAHSRICIYILPRVRLLSPLVQSKIAPLAHDGFPLVGRRCFFLPLQLESHNHQGGSSLDD